ncbi:chemotaxis protein CheA [Halobacterium bonnevillei]|uniref:Chemotaxis protein CheA n=1 Tax=Halobacterium bonnevillei TaxID=2692200 RepID=A0A6B0SQA8_9EURY|nr:chemotaxis protein CheA [Halobacterium bonnevillei]MXR21030.1 chemotaxis protein CheA [Halobacterium bonnevillei]
MDDYLEAFVREGEEHVTNLNNALLELESDPGDEEAMDAIFRTAHTLKGNFGAMGFEDASDLAHAVEDLLDAMRQGDLEVTGDRMDRIFEGVDAIEACLDEIEATGEVDRDVSGTVTSVRAVLEEAEDEPDAGGDVDGDAAGTAGEDTANVPDSDPYGVVDPETVAAVDDRVFHVDVEMGDSQMKAVDGMFVVEAAEEAFDILGTDPSLDAINDGNYEGGFELVVTSETADVAATVQDFPKLSGATVTELDPTADAHVGGAADAGTADAGGDGADEGSEADDGSRDSSGGEGEAAEASDVNGANGADGGGASGAGGDGGDGGDDGGSGADGDDGSSPVQSTDTEIQSVRVDVDQLDELHGLVEQLVTTRIKLRRGMEGSDREVEDELDELDKISASLQDTVMDMRLVPMKKIVGKFPRLVRDLAREQDKEIEFVVEGDDVELDRTILTEISDPLMHLLRNAVDHGIEAPEVREANGKDPEGTVTLSAERHRDQVIIEVRDDGGGIDRETVRRKAVEKDIFTEAEVEELTDSEVEDLVFHPGFSTNEEVTDVSGRGVGMDVVRDTVSRLDGSVSVSSVPGEGTTFTMTLPVTVAIVKVLFVESGGEEYGIPIKTVDEISRMKEVKRVDGEEVITYDETVYPLVRLGDALDVPGETRNGDGMLVRIRDSERQVAVHCDDVRGQEEVVVKPFEGILSGIPGLSGAAVLGEGDVVTILDVSTL